jgi:hypothetical protein
MQRKGDFSFAPPPSVLMLGEYIVMFPNANTLFEITYKILEFAGRDPRLNEEAHVPSKSIVSLLQSTVMP